MQQRGVHVLTITFNQMLAALPPLLLLLLGVETPLRRAAAACSSRRAQQLVVRRGPLRPRRRRQDEQQRRKRRYAIPAASAATCLAACLPLTPLTPPAVFEVNLGDFATAHAEAAEELPSLSVLVPPYYLAPVGAFFLLLAALHSGSPTRCAPAPSYCASVHPLEFLASASLGIGRR